MIIDVPPFRIGDGEPTFVVAEMAWSHDGSIARAKRIIDAAAEGGAQAINFHVTWLPDYMVADYRVPAAKEGGKEPSAVYPYFEERSLDFDQWAELARHAADRGLLVSALCNDLRSLEFCVQEIEPALLMIHPSCIFETEFVVTVARKGLPVVLYVGGLTLPEITSAVDTARAAGNDQIILQHGFQAYPTPAEDNALAFIDRLKRRFSVPIAFGDHTDGADPFAITVPSLAVAMGANVIEKHLVDDRARRGTDYESAVEPGPFKLCVEQLRKAERAICEPGTDTLGDRQLCYRELVRKRAVASRPLVKGARLAEADVTFKRANEGVFPERLAALIGRRLRTDVPIDTGLTDDVVE